MIDKTILAATSASSDNPEALAALALIELSIAEPANSGSQSELNELIDKWGRTLQGVDPVVVDRLTTQLRAAGASLDALVTPLKQAS
jgi:hypothetical protein